MNYKSKAVPVIAEQVFLTETILDKELFLKYCDYCQHLNSFKLKDEFGGTIVEDGDWLVEFPNGEIHVLRNERFLQRFEAVDSYTPEEVHNAISMAKRWHEMGGDCV